MEELKIVVEKRNEIGRGKVGDIRKEGFIPAVIYGEGKEAQPIKVSRREWLHFIHQHHVENAVIKITIKDETVPRSCLIKEVQHDPVYGEIKHIDFHEISLTKVIRVNVPVVAKGEPVGVKQDGGSLDHVLWEIEVECLPTEIPEDIQVDVSALKIGDAIHIKDIKFASTYKVLDNPDSIVLSVVPPMKEEVPAEGEEGGEQKEPEVIKEKKEVPAEGKEEKDNKKA